MFFENFWNIVKKTFKAWNEDGITHISASLAYYTIFSLAPLLVISISLTGLIFGNTVAENQILDQIKGMLGASSANQIKAMIQGANQFTSGIVMNLIGIAVLLFAAAGFFAELQTGLNAVWKVKTKSNRGILGFVKDHFLSMTMVLGVAFLLLISLVISTLISALSIFIDNFIPGATIIWPVINFLISLSIITFLFAALFKYLPKIIISWRVVWPGAFITALLFSLGKVLIETYLGTSDFGTKYGAAGSLIAILVWVYYSVQILFIGAEFTKVNASMHSSKIKAAEDAVTIKKIIKKT